MRNGKAMDSFEFNKIAGAVLGTCLALLTLSITAEAIFAPHLPAKPGFEVKLEAPVKPQTPAKPEAPGAGVAEAKFDEPIGKFLASANIERGQGAAKLCATCHTFQKGGPNGQGPNLYGVVGRARASAPGFAYSEAMKAKGGQWTVEDLNKFLTSPKDFVPGTKMNFQGFSKGGQRADVIAYLNSLADSPKPLPVAQQ
jgi:cytochrome c